MGMHMGTKAVANYFLALIEEQPDLKIATVQDAAGVRGNYLWRLANGENAGDIKAKTIAALVRATRGHLETAMDLLLRPDATEKEGKAAAQAWLREAPQRKRMEQLAERILQSADHDLDRGFDLLAQMRTEERYSPGTYDFIEAILRARRAQRGD